MAWDARSGSQSGWAQIGETRTLGPQPHWVFRHRVTGMWMTRRPGHEWWPAIEGPTEIFAPDECPQHIYPDEVQQFSAGGLGYHKPPAEHVLEKLEHGGLLEIEYES